MTRRKLSLRLLSITRRVLPPLAASIVARVVFLMIGVCLFALGGWAVASLAAGTSAWSIPVIIVCAVVLSLLKGGARYLEQFAGHFVAFHCLAMLRNYFYDQLEPQAPAGTDRLDSGDIMNRVTKDIDRVEVFFAHTLAPVTTAVIVPILTLVWMGTSVSWGGRRRPGSLPGCCWSDHSVPGVGCDRPRGPRAARRPRRARRPCHRLGAGRARGPGIWRAGATRGRDG